MISLKMIISIFNFLKDRFFVQFLVNKSVHLFLATGVHMKFLIYFTDIIQTLGVSMDTLSTNVGSPSHIIKINKLRIQNEPTSNIWNKLPPFLGSWCFGPNMFDIYFFSFFYSFTVFFYQSLDCSGVYLLLQRRLLIIAVS